MNLKPGGDLASIDGSHDGVRTRASPKLVITPKRIELALRLACCGVWNGQVVFSRGPFQKTVEREAGPPGRAFLRSALAYPLGVNGGRAVHGVELLRFPRGCHFRTGPWP
jgi:hypothetical protein